MSQTETQIGQPLLELTKRVQVDSFRPGYLDQSWFTYHESSTSTYRYLEAAPVPGAMKVGVQGPNSGQNWWRSDEGHITGSRACQFDDEFVFNADGSFPEHSRYRDIC